MSAKTRYLELDLLRSFAVIGMIVYHAAYDLQMISHVDIDVLHGVWKLFERIIANTFLLLVGISFAISSDRTEPQKRWKKFLKRGLLVLGCAMLVSGATYVVDPESYVRFGVLHLIGVSILLLPFFVRLNKWNLPLAIVCIVAAQWIQLMRVPTSLFLPLGLRYSGFQTVDYFPLLPWFGVVLIGLVIGQMFYVKNLSWRSKVVFLKAESYKLKTLTLPGRYALIIYLVHQPALLLILKYI